MIPRGVIFCLLLLLLAPCIPPAGAASPAARDARSMMSPYTPWPSSSPRSAPGRSILNGRASSGSDTPSSSVPGNAGGTFSSGGVARSAPSRTGPERPGGTGTAPPSAPNFERALHACLYRDKLWLLPGQMEYPAGQTLAALAPTFITGAMSVTAGSLPDRQTVINWSGLRRAVRKQAGDTAFDIVLDLRQYADPAALAAQMAGTAARLEAEAWTLTGVSATDRRQSGLLAAAVHEARRQGRKVGVHLDDRGPGPRVGLDYIVLSYEHGGKFPVRRGAGGAGGPPALVVAGAANGPPGNGFARGISPAERRLMVMRAGKAQKGGLAFAYPVFGPMSGPDQAYNALRDEFMLDTVRRSLKAYSPVPR